MERYNCISSEAALLHIQRYRLEEGKAAEVPMIRVANAAGLELHIAAGRAMDITELRYRGMPLNYFSGTDITHGSYYDPRGYEWLRSFYGGFLTTCGLDQVGEPCLWDGVEKGLHGPISNCPAFHVSTDVRRDGAGGFRGTVSGVVRQVKQQGENLELRRTYAFTDGEAAFTMTDEITNLGATPWPYLILYHFNFGYPFLSPALELDLPVSSTAGWDDFSEAHKGDYKDMAPAEELTLVHTVCTGPDGLAHLKLRSCGTALDITYPTAELPLLGQWRHLQPREYVLALEPCNNHLMGCQWEREHGTLRYLQPDETRRIAFRITCEALP